jgi:hypothetical protein
MKQKSKFLYISAKQSRLFRQRHAEIKIVNGCSVTNCDFNILNDENAFMPYKQNIVIGEPTA